MEHSIYAERIRKVFGEWIEAKQATRLFERFPPELQRQLRVHAGLVFEEQPLVACYLNQSTWAVLTTQRFIWRLADHQTTLTWEELADVQMLQRPPRSRQGQGAVATSSLQVVARSGQAYLVELEAGQPFFGFWTALKMISRAYRA